MSKIFKKSVLSLACVLSLAFLFEGCFAEEIDEINEKINSLIEENNLLKKALSENTASDAISDANINTSISEVSLSLETLKDNLTKSINDLKTLQESLTESQTSLSESQTSLLDDLRLISLDIESITSSITGVSMEVEELNPSSSPSFI